MLGPCAILLFLLSRVTYAACFIITTPYDWNINQDVTLYWTPGQDDVQQFCVKLFNPRLLRSLFTIAVTLTAQQSPFTFSMPPVPPGDGYILSFVDVSNDFNVYATSAPFSIGSNGAPPDPNGGFGTFPPPPPPGATPPPGEQPPDQFGDTVTLYSTVTGPDTIITITSTRTPTPSPSLQHSNALRTLDQTKVYWSTLLLIPMLCGILPMLM